MAAEAKEVMKNLFAEENWPLWCVSCPSNNPTELPTHHSTPITWRSPSAGRNYQVFPVRALRSQLVNEVIGTIGKAIDERFSGAPPTSVLHNDSFWTTFFYTLLIDMSGGLLMRPGHVRSEAEVRHELISPLLRRVAHSMSSVAPPEGWHEPAFSSVLNVECATESCLHRRGAKPSVDYTLVGHCRGKLLYRVPVEVKKRMSMDDIGQLAQYMASLGHPQNNMGVGYLIDESAFRVAFAPLSHNGQLLPVVLFSPSIQWREDTTFHRGACISLCPLQQLSTPCVTYAADALSECLGSSCWTAVMEAAEAIAQETVPSSYPGVVHDFIAEVESLKLKVQQLQGEVAALRQQSMSEN